MEKDGHVGEIKENIQFLWGLSHMKEFFVCLFCCTSACRILVPAAAAAAKSLQSCPTLCNPIDSSPPGSTVPEILQARTLEWVAISFSNAGKWKAKVNPLSCVQLLATPWTVAYQAPPSMGFSRQEYWSGVPLPSPYLGLNLVKDIKTYSWKTVRNWWNKLKLTQIHGKIYHVQKLEELILLKWS